MVESWAVKVDHDVLPAFVTCCCMFDLRRARSLHAVARHGTVSAAAAALHLTTSAFSQQLAELERELGQPLLVHRGRGVALTEAGILLVEHTEAILSRMTQAETDLQAQRGAVTGRMAIAAFATATRTVLPPAPRRLRDQHPCLRLEPREQDPASALRLLLRGDVDIALVAAGPGIGLVPRLGLGPVPAGVVIRPVRPAATRRIFALWRTHSTARPAVEAGGAETSA